MHLISSLVRGGRERQLAHISRHSPDDLVVAMNRREDSYVEEYGLSRVVYLEQHSVMGRFRELLALRKRHRPAMVWAWGGFEAYFAMPVCAFSNTVFVNGSIRHGVVKRNVKQISRLLLLQVSRHRIANSMAGIRANGLRHGHILRNGIDPSFFAISDRRGNLQRPARLISVANLLPYKDYFTILRALADLRDRGFAFHYHIVGDGPMRPQIEGFIRDHALKERVALLGKSQHVRDLLAKADVFVHSSKGEGTSNAIIEAMAAGLPCLATDTGGTGEILPPSSLYPYQDWQALAKALEKHLLDPAARQREGMRMKSLAYEQFSMEKMMERYELLVARILSSRRNDVKRSLPSTLKTD